MCHFSYGVVGWLAKGLVGQLKDLEEALEKAGIRVALPAYASFMLFISFMVFLLSLLYTPLFAFLAFRLPVFPIGIILGVFAGLLGFGGAFIITYMLPSLVAGRRKSEVEVNLPFTLSFMSILASAGLPPNRIFKALAVLEERGHVGLAGEAKNILRDMELFGVDLSTALKEAARRCPSKILAGIFEGMIAVIHSGGDLGKYFDEEARSLMRARRAMLREFIDTLLMLAEVYMSLFIAFPLILLLLLAIMSFMGGGAVAGFTPEMLIMIIIYVMVPVFSILYLVMLNLITPRE